MGRPPIGKVAMTSTERSRRYRAGLAAKPAATKPGPDHRKREIAKLKAVIFDLEQLVDGLMPKNIKRGPTVCKPRWFARNVEAATSSELTAVKKL